MKLKNSSTHYYLDSFRRIPLLGATAVIAISYALLHKLSFLITINNGPIAPIYLPPGLALAAILIMKRKALIGIGIGAFYSNAFSNSGIGNQNNIPFSNNISSGILISIGIITACVSTIIILKKFSRKGHLLSNGQNVLCLLVLAPISYAAITSLIGVSALFLKNTITFEQFVYDYETWWFGDAMGIILIAPLLLSWFSKDVSNKNNSTYFELVLLSLITIVVCLAVFFHFHDLKYLLFPSLFWAAYRCSLKITTLLIFIVSLFVLYTTVHGIGPFNEENINDSILFLDLFLSTTIICTLFLAGIISERQKADDAIKTSESNLRENQILLKSTIESPKNFSIYSLNLNYEYLSFNSQHKYNMKKLFDADITLGMKLHDCNIRNQEFANALETLEKAFLGESSTTVNHFDFDNSFWEHKTSPIYNQDKKIIGATVISTNITEKIKNEEALKFSEEKYRNIFENIQDVIFQTDINGYFMALSPSIENFCGYTEEELIGKPSYILQPNGEQDDIVIKLVNEQSVVNYYEKLIKTKSGQLKHISLSAKMIFDSEGNKLHINAIARDITQRKENEREIAFQNQKLQIQNKELEQFAYITSHDLQEPLITLKYFSELIKNDFPGEADENLHQYLKFILESSDRMQKLVKGLLDYSRIGSQSQLQKIDCNAIAASAIEALAEEISASNCEITAENLPVIDGFASELTELFQHLISNSIKFRKENVPLIIKITSKLIDNNWLFSVEDNGIGIDEQNNERAFIIFKRLNNREEYSGIGIGLAICKKIVTLHRGNIWIESSLGLGTTIHFNIPNQN